VQQQQDLTGATRLFAAISPQIATVPAVQMPLGTPELVSASSNA